MPPVKFFLAIPLALSLALLCRPAAAGDLPETRIRVVGSWDFLSQYKDFELPLWTKTVPEASSGKITAEIAGFNKMGLKGPEMVRLMELGQVDFGTTVLAYVADSDEITEGVDLAGLTSDVATARKVVEAFTPELDKHFQTKYGVKILAVWPYPAQVVWCKDKIAGIADLKGRKVRVGTRPIGEFIEAIGGVTVNIPFGDIYQKMQEGAADCVVTGSLSGNAAKLYEVTTQLYNLPLGWSMAMNGVNQRLWDSYDPAVRDFLSKQITAMADGIWKDAEVESVDGVNCNIGASGCTKGKKGAMTLVPVSDADREAVRTVLQTVVLKRWAQRCGADCVATWNGTVGKIVSLTAVP